MSPLLSPPPNPLSITLSPPPPHSLCTAGAAWPQERGFVTENMVEYLLDEQLGLVLHLARFMLLLDLAKGRILFFGVSQKQGEVSKLCVHPCGPRMVLGDHGSTIGGGHHESTGFTCGGCTSRRCCSCRCCILTICACHRDSGSGASSSFKYF